MLTDPIADMLTRIRNANRAMHDSASMPTSRMKEEIARLLKDEGYIKDFKVVAAEPVAIHDKTHLLPFFERTPAWLAQGDAGLTAGRSPAVLRSGERISIGPLLCYEVLFPSVARRQVEDGATLLVNLSNDAWFAGSGGAEQHFAAAVVLAATLGRPLLRATPSGVTAAVAASGRVAARLPADRPGALVVDVTPSHARTPASRTGDAPAWIALAVAALWTGAAAAGRWA